MLVTYGYIEAIRIGLCNAYLDQFCKLIEIASFIVGNRNNIILNSQMKYSVEDYIMCGTILVK